MKMQEIVRAARLLAKVEAEPPEELWSKIKARLVMKVCYMCKKTKPLTDFWKCKKHLDGHAYMCKECSGIWYKQYRKDNPEQVKEWTKKTAENTSPEQKQKNTDRAVRWRREHPARAMLALTKSRAKRKGIPFALVLDDIVIPLKCPILGITLQGGVVGKRTLSSPSIDKKIPELGYVKGNVQVISLKANVMKNNATTEELLKFSDWVRTTYGTTTVPAGNSERNRR